MNISPSDAFDVSQAPIMASGEVPDRMEGSGASKRPTEVVGDLKKAGGDSSSSAATQSLKKPPVTKQSKATAAKGGGDDDEAEQADGEDVDDDDQEEAETSAVASKTEPSSASSDVKVTAKKRRSRKKWKKPKDKPSRPLSAYNLFFRKERAEMLGDDAPPGLEKGQKRVHRKTHGKIGFADMARIIGSKWKKLPAEERKDFEEVAAKEKERYTKELSLWKENEKKKAAEEKRSKQASKNRAMKMMSAKEDEDGGGEGVGFLQGGMFRNQEEQWMRMQMMQNMHMQGGGFPFAAMGASQRPTPAIDYLRAMQDERAATTSLLNGRIGGALGPMGGVGGSSSAGGGGNPNQYPNASENTASALLNQFQGGMGGAMDLSGRSVSEIERLQQIQMARMQSMQMMNSSMMGGSRPMGLQMPMGSPMSGAMGFGSSQMSGAGGATGGASSQQQLQQMRMMNQLQGGGTGGTGDTMDASMRRMQNRFSGGNV